MNFFDKLKQVFGISADDDRHTASQPNTEIENSTPSPPPAVSTLPPAPLKREEIIRFIIESLRPYTDERETGIKGLRLYLLCKNNAEAELARVALYSDQPGKFKEELQRKLDNNFIHLPGKWNFEFELVKDHLPDSRFRIDSFGLDILDSLKTGHFPLAKIIALQGQLSVPEYILDPNKTTKFYIGRGQHPVLESGRTHTNNIFFLEQDEAGYDEEKAKANRFVSRNHAYITFNTEALKYFLFVDKGGLSSSGNKTKIYKAGETEKVERLEITGAAHELSNGDQIELGGEAILLFRI